MKSPMNFYILGGALVLLILLTASCACCDFKPHSNKVQYARYEGMEGEEGEGGEEGEEGEEEPFTEYMNDDEGDEDDEGFTEYMNDDEGDEDDEDDEGFAEYMKEMIENDESEDKEPATILNQIKDALGITKQENMSNMEPRPYSENDLYDMLGQTVGNLDCGSKSAGLSNSKGPLCLNKKQLNMLSTRGGNATSDAQIGA